MSRAHRFLPLFAATALSSVLSLVAAAIVFAGESGIPLPK